MSAEARETGAQKGRKAAMRAAMALVAFLALAAFVFVLSPAARYDWARAVHVIAIISWMAGMLYLPRLFVYHCDAEPGSVQAQTFVVMERRLLKVIMLPAMLVSWAFGLWLAWAGSFWLAPWFVLKMVAVLAMTAAHGYLARSARHFAEGTNTRSAGHWRMVNEVPTLAMIAAVILVIVKPL
ncbi:MULTISPECIES: protoporphyrinogen oxidase HemJ [unclassified Roseitalea]|uniref:protoporphyrinogen oxidase HemJ n=1 Tax=unclassified Roseitalea TaxID=2639107 RepID=UPI00273EC0A0|nr:MULTISPECIES: protoporphyrinogen oxidase HemJ [unclassified Roseitalea]